MDSAISIAGNYPIYGQPITLTFYIYDYSPVGMPLTHQKETVYDVLSLSIYSYEMSASQKKACCASALSSTSILHGH